MGTLLSEAVPLSPSSDDLNFQPPRADGPPRLDPLNMEPNLVQIRKIIDEIRISLVRAQQRIERNERRSESLSRQRVTLWVAVILVIVGFGLWTGYHVIFQKFP
jgi:hypothetical protein